MKTGAAAGRPRRRLLFSFQKGEICTTVAKRIITTGKNLKALADPVCGDDLTTVTLRS
jgi:hypothetical protein